MINKLILVGRVGKDPEVKHLQASKTVANFSLATSEKYNDQEETEWHNITAWNKLADVIEKYVKKGDLLYIEGKIKTRSYEGNDGKPRYVTEVIANTMQMLGGNAKEVKRKTEQVDSQDLPF